MFMYVYMPEDVSGFYMQGCVCICECVCVCVTVYVRVCYKADDLIGGRLASW